MIYFVQPADGGPVKIGTTQQMAARLQSLRSASPSPLRVLGVMEGGRVEEMALHLRFKADRIFSEWFRPSDDLMALIEAESQPWACAHDADAGRKIRLDDGVHMGQMLYEMLHENGYTESTVAVSAVAEKVGLSRQRVSALLNARRIMPETLERIAKALGVPVKELRKKPKG